MTTLSYLLKWRQQRVSNVRDMGVSFQRSCRDYCRVPPKITESLGRLGIKETERFPRVEIMSTNFKKIGQPEMSRARTTRDRSVLASIERIFILAGRLGTSLQF